MNFEYQKIVKKVKLSCIFEVIWILKSFESTTLWGYSFRGFLWTVEIYRQVMTIHCFCFRNFDVTFDVHTYLEHWPSSRIFNNPCIQFSRPFRYAIRSLWKDLDNRWVLYTLGRSEYSLRGRLAKHAFLFLSFHLHFRARMYNSNSIIKSCKTIQIKTWLIAFGF